MATETTLTNFTINYLTQAQFNALSTKEANELYLTPDDSITGITAGTGLSGGGTSGMITLNHSNSIDAKSTQGIYPITFDGQGHITSAGSAVTISDTKVTQAYSTSNSSYPLLMTATAGTSSTNSRGATTAILNNAIYANPSTGNLQVTKLNGYTPAAAMAKSVDTTISASSSSSNLPTSAAVATFVEGKGYLTLSTLPIYDGGVS